MVRTECEPPNHWSFGELEPFAILEFVNLDKFGFVQSPCVLSRGLTVPNQSKMSPIPSATLKVKCWRSTRPSEYNTDIEVMTGRLQQRKKDKEYLISVENMH